MTVPLEQGSWEHEHLPRILPAGWRETDRQLDGAFFRCSNGLAVIVSCAVELDGRRWLHVSCSRANRLPSWEDLAEVKRVFVGRDRKAVQVLPAASEHVNIHPHVLHLFCCLDGDPLPDFTRGSGSL